MNAQSKTPSVEPTGAGTCSEGRASPRRSHTLIVTAASVGLIAMASVAAFAVRSLVTADREEPARFALTSAADSVPAGNAATGAARVEAVAEPVSHSLVDAAADSLRSRGAAFDDPALDRFGLANPPERHSDEIPREQRWRMFFEEGLTEGPYARQIEGVGIELGVLLAGGRIAYASSISQAKPVVREGAVADERRFYMTWSRGDLLKADISLLAKAGLDATAGIVLHFYSDELVDRLAALERDYKGLLAADIELTRFEVRPSPKGFEFFVRDQVPRK